MFFVYFADIILALETVFLETSKATKKLYNTKVQSSYVVIHQSFFKTQNVNNSEPSAEDTW